MTWYSDDDVFLPMHSAYYRTISFSVFLFSHQLESVSLSHSRASPLSHLSPLAIAALCAFRRRHAATCRSFQLHPRFLSVHTRPLWLSQLSSSSNGRSLNFPSHGPLLSAVRPCPLIFAKSIFDLLLDLQAAPSIRSPFFILGSVLP